MKTQPKGGFSHGCLAPCWDEHHGSRGVRDELPYLTADRKKSNRKEQKQDIPIKEMAV